MAALMSSSLPTLIFPPKPPVPLGHRKASVLAPKPDRPNRNDTTIDRLKNWRRVTPRVSSSGGTQATGGRSSTATGADDARRSSAAARSTSRPVTGRSPPDRSTGPRSRRTVSPLSMPWAAPVSRRRAEANSSTPASTTRTGTAMRMIVPGLMVWSFLRSQLEEQAFVPGEHEVLLGAAEERTDQHEHRPRHEEDREQRDRELAVLRLVRRVAVNVGGQDQADETDAGQRHAGDHGVEH